MRESEVKQDYFQWLIDMVHGDDYYILLKELHSRMFVSVIDHDNNRALDGMELREIYVTEEMDYEDAWKMDMGAPCTLLELFIGLARNMDFELAIDDEDRTERYFWEIMGNLGLSRFDDEHYVDENGMFAVDDILGDFINRNFEPDGLGGAFPLKNPEEDQRFVELWYQMAAYLGENYPM